LSLFTVDVISCMNADYIAALYIVSIYSITVYVKDSIPIVRKG
jgi:hypothetical protein